VRSSDISASSNQPAILTEPERRTDASLYSQNRNDTTFYDAARETHAETGLRTGNRNDTKLGPNFHEATHETRATGNRHDTRPIPTFYEAAHETRTTGNRHDAMSTPTFYEVPDDNSVDSEEEIAFLEPPNTGIVVVATSHTAASPAHMYKYGNFARVNSGFGSADVETESGEAESILASRTLEEKIQGLRM
jgi:hypothetical protein